MINKENASSNQESIKKNQLKRENHFKSVWSGAHRGQVNKNLIKLNDINHLL